MPETPWPQSNSTAKRSAASTLPHTFGGFNLAPPNSRGDHQTRTGAAR